MFYKQLFWLKKYSNRNEIFLIIVAFAGVTDFFPQQENVFYRNSRNFFPQISDREDSWGNKLGNTVGVNISDLTSEQMTLGNEF